MKEYKQLTTIEMVDDFIQEHALAFLYVSRTNCSVCKSVLPQLQELLDDYPHIQLGYINADHLEEIAGRLTIFTVPTLLLFIEGKEYIREARFIHFEELQEKIDKIYSMYSH